MNTNKDLSIPAQPRGFQFRRGLATFLMLCGLCGLTCQSDDICRGVDGACLAIDVDAELEPLPLPGVTLEAVLTTSGNQEQVGDPDVSVIPLTALPLRWRITKLPGSVTPSQISKLEILARLPAGSGGGAGEIIASSIVEPLSWSDGTRQRIAVKLAPVAKPDPIATSPLPTSAGTSLDLAGQRLCYRHPDGTLATSITLGGKAATIETCETQKAKITLPALTWKKEGLQLLIKHASARPAAAGPLPIYPANFALHAPRSYPLPDRARREDAPARIGPIVQVNDFTTGHIATVGNRNGFGMGDFDGDGNMDIAVPNYGLNRSTTMEEPTKGDIFIVWGGSRAAQARTIRQMPEVIPGLRPFSISVEDVNKDGADDLFVTSFIEPGELQWTDQVAGAFLIYGIKGDRDKTGSIYQKIDFARTVNPYGIITNRLLPASDQNQSREILTIDGQQVDTMNNRQTDELYSCYGIIYAQSPPNGSNLSCAGVITERPFDRMAPVMGKPDGANAFIPSMSAILASDPPLASQNVAEALLLTNFGKNRVAILRNKKLTNPGGGRFFDRDTNSDFPNSTTAALPIGKNPVSAILADVDFDGKEDLLVAMKQSSLVLYRGTGDRSSTNFGIRETMKEYQLINTNNNSVVIHDMRAIDIDNDKKNDVVLATNFGVLVLRSAANAFNKPDPIKIQATADVLGYSTDPLEIPQQIQATDIDKDGYIDLAVLDKDTSSLVVINGKSSKVDFFIRPQYLYQTTAIDNSQLYGVSYFGDSNRSLVAVTNQAANYVTRFQSIGSDPCCKDIKNTKPFLDAKRPRDVIVTDLDRDGQVDYLVSYDGVNTSGAAIYWGDQPDADPLVIGDKMTSRNTYVRLSDLNSDGYDDLIVLRWADEVALFRNNSTIGNRGFSDTKDSVLIPSSTPVAVATIAWKEYEEVNSDSLIDLSIASNDAHVYIYKNKGGGCTDCYTGVTPIRLDLPETALALDAQYMTRTQTSGIKDLVALTRGGVHVYQNGFAAASAKLDIINLDYRLDPQVVSWAIGDLNADGINDIAILNSNRSLVSIYLGSDKTGQRTWPLHGHYAVGIQTTAITIADYDRDGLPDIVAANYRGANVSLVKNISN